MKQISKPEGGVVAELELRANAVNSGRSGETRSDKDLSFLHRNSIWLEMEVPETGFKLGDSDDPMIIGGFDDIYNLNGASDIPHTPKRPVITDFDITAGGSYGHIQQATLVIKTFNLNQIDLLDKELFIPRRKVIVKFGWTLYLGDPNLNKFTYYGYVYSWGFVPDQNGGYVCSINMTTVDSSMAFINMNTFIQSDILQYDDANRSHVAGNLCDAIVSSYKKDLEATTQKIGETSSGVFLTIDEQTSQETYDSIKLCNTVDTIQYMTAGKTYIKFEPLISLLQSAFLTKLNHTIIIDDDNSSLPEQGTDFKMPNGTDFRSIDPKNIIFPWSADYEVQTVSPSGGQTNNPSLPPGTPGGPVSPIGGVPINNLRVTSGFGPRNRPTRNASSNHQGIDLGYPTGTPVMSTANGVVARTGNQPNGAGNYIVIRSVDANGNTYETKYMHLQNQPNFPAGTQVQAGQQIGNVGNTGTSTGSHLHFEVRDQNGNAINPTTYFSSPQFNSGTPDGFGFIYEPDPPQLGAAKQSSDTDKLRNINSTLGVSSNADLKHIYISIDFIYKTIQLITDKSHADLKNQSPDTQLRTFLDKIFDKIEYSSGGAFKLAYTYDVKEESHTISDKDKTRILIFNSRSVKNAEDPDEKLGEILTLDSDKHTIVKNINVTVQFSSQYIAMSLANVNNTDHSGAVRTIFNKDTELADYQAFNIPFETLGPSYNTAVSALYDKPDSSYTSTDANSILTSIIHHPDQDSNPINIGSIVPIKLTLDFMGINGLKIGNILNYKYLPKRYRERPDLAFIITGISHSVNKSDWVTSIDTIMKKIK